MPPKATKRTARSKSPSRPARNKRTRLQERTSHNETSQEQSDLPSYSETVNAVENESMSSQIQRYKAWRHDGSSHDDYCRVCHQTGRLEPCHTCKLAFHSSCMPSGWIRDSSNHWFCPICVRRNWHISPPALTPPASPELPAQDNSISRPAATDRNSSAPAIPNIITLNQGQEPLRDRTQSLHPPATGDKPAPSAAETQSLPIHVMPNESPSTDRRDAPIPNRRNRKSRFSTLSHEVDASLSVLYQELESVSSLRAQVEELEKENARCLQVIRIRDQNMIALRREMDRSRVSDEEIERLRVSAAETDSLKEEVKELCANKVALEADLKASREQTAAASKLLCEWKGKLAQLMN